MLPFLTENLLSECRMLKRQLSFFLIVLLALLLIVLVFWIYERRIQQIEREIDSSATPISNPSATPVHK